jgi:N-acetylglucosaminyl-diphospho-decaprenol L-rhamnosyltransferase
MMQGMRAKLVVLIVSYGNPLDVDRCLKSLARSSWKDFEVFVCENAGRDSFHLLEAMLTQQTATLEPDDRSDPIDEPGGRLAVVAKRRLRDLSIRVHLAASTENLGYAGGVNAWLERFLADPGWEAVLVLNPDTEVNDVGLSELMDKAFEGFGMIGGTLVTDDAPDRVVNYGLRWSRMTGRSVAVGRDSPAGSTPTPEVLANIDAISGACVLVTRAFIEAVGLMNEDYFLYMEDLDWGQRRGHHRIGFAPKAIIRHVGSTSIGLAAEPKDRSPLSIYLTARNRILHARRWAGGRWVFHFATGVLEAAKYVAYGSPSGAKVAFAGLLDGVRGKTGRPTSQIIYKFSVR